MTDTIKKAHESTAPPAKDRRKSPRYKFTAASEVTEERSSTKLQSRVSDLGPRGCFVNTDRPFPIGTVVTVRITKDAITFQAESRVVYAFEGKGMGLFFTAVDPPKRAILATWVAASLETSWLASTRRQSQRVLVRLPVRVMGGDGPGIPLDEMTYTHAVSAHGALLLLAGSVRKGQRVILSNERTKASLECVVAHIGQTQDNLVQVGVAFILPNPGFWNVSFPPEDWSVRHPDAKSKSNIRQK